ncbi:MAG TPA: ADYC domain-containing protein [Hyalangium sp.]|nr:ADYC domain-containing protein [Hyalangium sp.]
MSMLKKCLFAAMSLQISLPAYAGEAPASKAQASKPGSAVAPLSDAERYARRCKGQAPQRTGNVQGTMLWGTRRDWDTEKPTPDSTSVLVSVDLDTLRPAGTEVKSLRLEGGHLAALPAGKGVAGLVLQGRASDGKPVEVAICGAETSAEDPDMVWYRIEAWNSVAQEWENPCVALDVVPKPRVLAVRGVWDASGAHQEQPGRFTFACENGAITKCVGWGYKPWASHRGQPLAELHQACTRMARADYCGDGRSHTHQGTSFDFYDRVSLNTPSTEPSALWDPARGSFEAAWGPDGAVCLSHTRDGRSVESVVQGCPNRFRTGPEVDLGGGDRCSVQRTDVSPKSALLRNRSYGVPPGGAPPAAAKP